ncbi:thiol reductant ABC exporter subunit CydC [Aeromicrobium senzhongii]|uniref:Thiol reductant ABC exporter subunit CydC n=1 Tax=Aeromicrobium senzhongii TaxID=2663859 RepID=A0ABX6SZN4_9ACTN|nr:thiol reductant ABC exporter subunit CydC [Aeromicrobium senzhongii]MTB87187.1 thiol reductant ABC exporter subunit CydC [Aeromicrobium senzhongii]QNL95735.1 thiol reductant ABC exporter subunit CydC [Aeromicrobium senzhongii]
MSRTYPRRARLAYGVTMGVAAQLAAVGLLLASAWLIVRAAEQPPVLYLMVAIVSVRFFGISRSVLRYLERLATHDVALADAVEQRVTTYVALDRAAPAGLGGLRRGDLVSRVVADVARMQDRLLRLRVPWWVGLVATLVVVGVVGVLDARSGLVILAGVAVCAIALRRLVPLVGARRSGRAEAQGRLSAEVAASAVAARELVAFGAADEARAKARAATQDAQSAQSGGASVAGMGSAIVLAVAGLTVALLAAWSAGIDPVVIGVILLAPIALVEPWDGWSEAERLRPEIAAAGERLAALAALSNPVVDPERPADLPDAYDLVVDDVVVGWEGPVTAPISFRVGEGEVVAVTGPSGVGKSTLAYALARLLPTWQGDIVLGGVPTRDILAADVRRRVGYLGQDDAVFDTSVRENLRIADPDADDDRLRAALASAGLLAAVDAMPQGLDTSVGEHGGRLSGGERQRLCLARLLLADHRVLVLDEPTEHLDAPTAAALMDDVLALAGPGGRSLVVISHSPSVLARFASVIEVRPADRPVVTHAVPV